MKKHLLALAVLLLIPSMVIAKAQGQAQGQGQTQGQGQGNVVQQQLRKPATEVSPQGNQYQNLNQQQVQNQGEESQLQNQIQEEEADINDIKGGVNRSENAKAKMSAVAAKVQELLNDPELEGGIGPQIREFAKSQHQVQNELESTQAQIQKRNQLMRVVLGPDYKALKNMEKLYERNQVRIQTLTELVNQTQNEAELNEITEMVQLLTEQNTALAEQINNEEARPGILGWFFRLFNR